MVTHPTHAAEGFLLLTLRNVEAWLPGSHIPIVDQLALECITLPLPAQYSNGGSEGERDVWLVLRVGPNEMPIAPTQVVHHSRQNRSFVFDNSVRRIDGGSDANWTIRLPQPQSAMDEEDIETFEVILEQYAAVEEIDTPPPAYTDEFTVSPISYTASKRPVPPSPTGAPSTPQHVARGPPPPLPPRALPGKREPDADLKGRLVLVDEEDGEIVGSLGDQFRIREDEKLNAKGHEKDPVVVDLPDGTPESGKTPEVYVHAIPYDQQDFIMKTATLISRGIVLATDVLASGMSAASSLYISHSTPDPEPLVFSERTRGRVRRVHKISCKAVQVSAKTTGLIHEAIERAVGYVAGSGKSKSRPTTPVPGASGSTPRSYYSPAPGSLAPPGASPGPVPGAPPPLPPRPPLRNRILLSTDLLLTTIENSAQHLIEHGSQKLSDALGHKYGKDMGETSLLMGHTVRNVGVVYIDARGVGRRALLKTAGKSFIRAKLGKRDVVLGVDERGQGPAGTLTVQDPGAVLPKS